MSDAEQIPQNLHFVWLGAHLPCFAALAAKSAKACNPQASVLLWHDETLTPSERTDALESFGVSLRRLDIRALIASAVTRGTPLAPISLEALATIYARLRSPAARSNVARLLLLYCEGGIYLDTDTLTLKSLDLLRASGAFCGLEHVLWSKERLDKRHLYFWTLGPLLSGVRLINARLPWGHSWQRALLGYYARAANNAVLGFSAGHPFLASMLARICELPEREWTKRYRLGTHLLQQTLAAANLPRRPSQAPVHQYGPEYFYPLGPVTSAHYFRSRRDAASVARQLIPETTHVVHWYASVADLSGLDEAHIAANEHTTVFAHLCARYMK